MHHDSSSKWVFSDFYQAASYMYEKYRQTLPIATTCVVIEDRHGRARFHTDFIALLSMTLHSIFKYPKRIKRPRFKV